MDFVKESWKAIVAFGAIVVAQLVNNLSADGAVIPTDLKGWGVLLGAALAGAAVVYMKGQAPNAKQLEKNPDATDAALAKSGYRRIPVDETLPPNLP